MTRLYLVRHCEALGNTMRIFQGSTDCDISETGAKQLEFLQQRFKNTRLDAVYSSPLIRAYKTALAVAKGSGVEVIKVDGLREVHGGEVEGRPFAEVFATNSELGEIWDNHPQDFAPKGGEPMRVAYERIYDTVTEILRENRGKTIAIASHGGVIRCLLCRYTKGSIERLKDIPWTENTSVTLIEFDDNLHPQIKFLNNHLHVPDEYLPKRNRLSSFIGEKR